MRGTHRTTPDRPTPSRRLFGHRPRSQLGLARALAPCLRRRLLSELSPVRLWPGRGLRGLSPASSPLRWPGLAPVQPCRLARAHGGWDLLLPGLSPPAVRPAAEASLSPATQQPRLIAHPPSVLLAVQVQGADKKCKNWLRLRQGHAPPHALGLLQVYSLQRQAARRASHAEPQVSDS